MNKKLICLCFLFLFLISNVSATITLYLNWTDEGRHFSQIRTFNTVERISGIWYYNGQTYEQIENATVIIPELGIFGELIFGEGAWIGFMIITILSFALAYFEKFSGIITGVIFILLGLQYLNLYNSGSSDLIWFWLLSWIVAVFLFLQIIKRSKY